MTKKNHQKFLEIDGHFWGENRDIFWGTPEKRLFAALLDRDRRQNLHEHTDRALKRKGHVAAPLLKRCFSDSAGSTIMVTDVYKAFGCNSAKMFSGLSIVN